MPTFTSRPQSALLALIFLAALPAGGAENSQKPGDLSRLQGALDVDGRAERNIAVVLEIKDRTVSFEATTPQGLKVAVEGEVRIDDTARPKRVDWVHLTAFDGQELPDNLAIYEIDGDTFTICNGGPNNGRPSEFKPGGGALADLVVFTRRKDEGQDQGTR